MKLDYYLPSPWARASLSVHAVVDGVSARRVERLPAMLPNLFIRLEGSTRFILPDGVQVDAPEAALLGATSACYAIELSPGCRMVGVGLLPLGAACLPMLDMAWCADKLIDARGVWGDAAVAELRERLAQARLDGSHVDVMESFILGSARAPASELTRQVFALDRWLEHDPHLDIDNAAAALAVGQRQLRRLTLARYGLTPKTLAMKYRALRLAARQCALISPLEAPGTFDGYADQSHAIRDFRRFVGWTPGALRQEQLIAAQTLRGRRLAGAERPLILLS